MNCSRRHEHTTDAPSTHDDGAAERQSGASGTAETAASTGGHDGIGPDRATAAGSEEPMLAVLIPVDQDEPVRIEQVPQDRKARTAAFHDWVDGLLEVLTFEEPAASLYCNEEGKNLDMPVNLRATGLLWLHNPLFRERDVVCGPAFILGPVDEEGEDTTAPPEMVHLAAETGTWQVQSALSGPVAAEGPQWQVLSGHSQWHGAYGWAAYLDRNVHVRVVPSVDDALMKQWRFNAAVLVHHENGWVGDGSETSVLACRDLSDLSTQVLRGGHEPGQAFSWRDLCLLNCRSVNGSQSWVALRYGCVMDLPPLTTLPRQRLQTLLTKLAALTAEDWRSGQ